MRLLRRAVLASCLAATFSFGATITRNGTLAPEGGGGRTGTGTVAVTIDDVLNTLRVQTTFSGLSGTTTASHIHAPTALPLTGNAGVATQVPTFIGFPLGVHAGSYDHTFDLTLASSFNPSFVTAQGGLGNARNTLINSLLSGRAYLNIHTTTFGGGEIRAYLVPEPATFGFAGAAIAGLLLSRRYFSR